MLREVVSAGAHLHCLAEDSFCLLPGVPDGRCRPYQGLQTPLTAMFTNLYGIIPFSRYNGNASENNCTAVTSIWLEQLQLAGVDLVEYGQKEGEIHNRKRGHKEWLDYDFSDRVWSHRLVSFTYGPDPSDWKFYFTQVMENYFVQFWDMVDHPERALPGAWVEDEDEDEKYSWKDRDYDYEFETDDCDVVGEEDLL